MEYLLAAEADRIQDLLFRSSQLREVVGGSQLLSRFCDDVPGLMGATDRQVVTSGGGSFRITFETKEDARRFGAALGELYYRATGGTLSVAEPVEVADGSQQAWEVASEEAGERLRRAKRSSPPVATPHLPHIAFCESCGVGLAEAHEAQFDEGAGQYICRACLDKATEREKKSKVGFLKKFYDRAGLSALDWPEDADDVAQYDPRDYVAYIVADGDGMGRVFGECDKAQSAALSQRMEDVLREALAEPTRRFMKNEAANRNPQLVPVLPLILGGDDLFALVPAPWGLDFARWLCRTFQRDMTQWAHDNDISHEITMSAVVVICKANYPYYLAHQIGEERLSATKRVVKALAHVEKTHLSAVDFEVVLGSQAASHERSGEWRPTLRPYWVTIETKRRVPNGWGLAINRLLDWRHQLVGTPSRRLSQLREHFDQAPPGGVPDHWDKGLQRILARIERDWSSKDKKHPVQRALEDLGGVELENWYELDRKNDEDFRHGHGMPDLLRAWDWTLNLEYPPIAYEGGER